MTDKGERFRLAFVHIIETYQNEKRVKYSYGDICEISDKRTQNGQPPYDHIHKIREHPEYHTQKEQYQALIYMKPAIFGVPRKYERYNHASSRNIAQHRKYRVIPYIVIAVFISLHIPLPTSPTLIIITYFSAIVNIKFYQKYLRQQ
jgi:hypothetical protein